MASHIAPRNRKILDILKSTYPHAKIILNYRNNWELLVAVILSAQCTDTKVNEVTAKLFSKYRNSKLHLKSKKIEVEEVQNFAFVPIEELEKDIKPTGFYHHKAKNIQGAAKMILEKYNGRIPNTMEEILKLPGVARKTANVVLGNAYGAVEGIAVDTHVIRLSQRLRLINLNKIGPSKKPTYYISGDTRRGAPSSTRSLRDRSSGSEDCRMGQPNGRTRTIDYFRDAKPEKIEQELMKIIPKEDWFKFTYQIINHGRAICKAQNPKCEVCLLSKICPVSRV